MASITELFGKTLRRVENFDNQRIEFETDAGETYVMFHRQDCCENVTVDDIAGDLQSLVGSPILKAEESTSGENPAGVVKDYQDSFTWTFYQLATVNGYVTIRWYGESNGYYSESVDFEKADGCP